MAQILTISVAVATGLIWMGVGFDWAHRQISRKRTADRMCQALRRGLANPDGFRPRRIQVVQWQTCDSTSTRCS